MYTLQTQAGTYITGHAYGNIQTSGNPRMFKTRTEALKFDQEVKQEMVRLVGAYTNMADHEQKKVNKARKDVARLEAKLTELYTQPYKLVERKVSTTRKAIESARWYLTSNSIRSYRQSVSRIQKLYKEGMQIVQLTPVDA